MNISNFIRICGVAAILTGVFLPMWQILENIFPGYFLVIDLSLFLAVVGILLVLRREGMGRLALYALIAIVIGSLVYDLSNVVSVLGYAVGLILLGLGVWQAQAFPRWVPVMWIVTSLIILPGYFIGGSESLLVTLGGVAFGLGFIGAGIALLRVPSPAVGAMAS